MSKQQRDRTISKKLHARRIKRAKREVDCTCTILKKLNNRSKERHVPQTRVRANKLNLSRRGLAIFNRLTAISANSIAATIAQEQQQQRGK